MRDGVAVDHMKLQKLVYIAHGWHMAVVGEELISDSVYAWTYGPVIPNLYHRLKRYGSRPITEKVCVDDPETGLPVPACATLPERTTAVMDRVWNSYKGLNGLQLSTLTHKENTPWFKMVGNLPAHQRRNRLILNKLIQEHYLELGRKK